MKKILLISLTLILVFLTTFVKNFTKKIDEEIYVNNEKLSLKKEKIDMLKLEYDYLTSPSNLLEYQKVYFDDELIPIQIENIGKLKNSNKKIIFKDIEINDE